MTPIDYDYYREQLCVRDPRHPQHETAEEHMMHNMCWCSGCFHKTHYDAATILELADVITRLLPTEGELAAATELLTHAGDDIGYTAGSWFGRVREYKKEADNGPV